MEEYAQALPYFDNCLEVCFDDEPTFKCLAGEKNESHLPPRLRRQPAFCYNIDSTDSKPEENTKRGSR